jgi:hypothetical protein
MVSDYSKAYQRATNSILKHDLQAARGELFAVPTWQPPPNSRKVGRTLSCAQQLHVFSRDHFICRYCDRRTVFVPVLRLLSLAVDDVFPYHPHGKMSACHLAFWRDIASCDHVVPIARHGTSESDNLVTACYLCNSIKQNWLVEELRWEVRPVRDEMDWDGLTRTYPELLKAVQSAQQGAHIAYFKNWLRALQSRRPVLAMGCS